MAGPSPRGLKLHLSWLKQLKLGVPHPLRFVQRVRLRFLRTNSVTSFWIECGGTIPRGKVKPAHPLQTAQRVRHPELQLQRPKQINFGVNYRSGIIPHWCGSSCKTPENYGEDKGRPPSRYGFSTTWTTAWSSKEALEAASGRNTTWGGWLIL